MSDSLCNKSHGICELDDFDNFDCFFEGHNNVEHQGRSRMRSRMTSDGTSAVDASDWSIKSSDSFKQQLCISDQGSNRKSSIATSAALTTPKQSI